MSRAGNLAVRLIVPGNVLHHSGGNAYNAALARELTALGAEVEIRGVDGHWPVGNPEERRRLAVVLLEGGGADESRVTIVDGLLALGAPLALERAAAAGRPAWILLHMPLPEHQDLERRALMAAAGVVCASSSGAAEIRARHRVEGAGADGGRLTSIHVALPGTDAAPPAAGSDPPHLVAVAALLPNKDQLLLLGALAGLKDLPWTAALVGSDSADPAYAQQVRSAVARLRLADRVRVPGELRGEAFDAEWHQADLSLLISQAEMYGMVVTESIARGIPVVVRDGTGAVEALAAGSPIAARDDDGGGGPALPGTAVVLGTDPAPLAGVLRGWLTDPDLRSRWRETAQAARNRLPGWDVTARTVLNSIATGRPGN